MRSVRDPSSVSANGVQAQRMIDQASTLDGTTASSKKDQQQGTRRPQGRSATDDGTSSGGGTSRATSRERHAGRGVAPRAHARRPSRSVGAAAGDSRWLRRDVRAPEACLGARIEEEQKDRKNGTCRITREQDVGHRREVGEPCDDAEAGVLADAILGVDAEVHHRGRSDSTDAVGADGKKDCEPWWATLPQNARPQVQCPLAPWRYCAISPR